MAQPPKFKNRRGVQLVGTVVSLGLLVILLLRQDWRELLRLATTIPAWVFIAGLALLAVRVISHGMRWLALLRAQDIQLGISEVLRLQWAGLYAGNFLPTSVGGDVVRLYGVLRASPSKVVAAASIVVDRSLGVIGMLFILPFSLPLWNSIFSGLALGLSLGQSGLMDRTRGAISRFRQALALWASKPQSLLLALSASWVGILSFLLMVWLLVRALEIPVSFVEVAGVGALNYYIALIPFSINSYGIRELGIVFFYTQLGASSEQALALALISRALMLLISVPGALLLPQVLSSRNVEGIQ
ncbi:MAG: YbhN family protein [Anaerolineales bacterium]